MSTATPREICQAARMHQVIRDVLDAMEDHYDGAPDSSNLWMAEHIKALDTVCRAADPLPVPEGAVEYRAPKEFIKE